nr:hypothetical protein [Tanacetum cinerariifolium]
MKLGEHVPVYVSEPEHSEYHAPSDDDIQVEDDDEDPEEDPSEEHEPEDGSVLDCVLPTTHDCVLVLRFVSCDLALRFGYAFCLIEDLIAFCLREALPNSKPRCQDIYAAGSKNRPPMLNKDNYVPWSSRIIRYARSRPNGKMIVDSIENGPYVRRMIATPGEPDLPVPVPESFHEQTNEELTETNIKRIDADDQAIQTILLGLPEDVYAAVDSCETAKEIWERVRQTMKGSDIGEQEKKAKLFNEWEKFTSIDGKSIESYYHRFMQLINDLKKNKHFPENIASNLKFLNNLQSEWKRHVTINGLVVVPGIANQNGTGNVVAARAEGTRNRNQARCYNCRGLGHIARNCTARPRKRDVAYFRLSYSLLKRKKKEFNFKLKNLISWLLQASTSGTQHDKAPVYDTDGSAENDNHVTFVAPSMGQSGGTVETSFAPNEETRAHQETVYQNLVDQVARVNMINCNMRATNAELKYELARYKIQEQRVKISQEKYDKPEKGYQKDQTVQTMHMLNPKPDSFYHPNQEMALGNTELAQESREKMRLLKKEIKPANYAKINHLSGVFVPQTTKSKEELFFSNVSNMVTVSKMISIPNEDLSDDTTPSVARKFLNEVKSSFVTLQRVVKQKMTLEVHNWSSSAHKVVHKIISHEIAPIINQVDARVQNFKIQFLQEAVKFIRDFKSLAKEADKSLDKQKSLELEIERLLKASVSHDIMSIVQNGFVDVPSDIRTELDRTKEKLELCIIKRKKNTLFFGIIGKSVTPPVDKPKLSDVTPHSKKLRASTQSHSVPQPREFNVVNHRNVIAPGMFKINPSQTP